MGQMYDSKVNESAIRKDSETDQYLHEAVKWYKKAADCGHKGAQYELGRCYWEGRGISKDPDKAIECYEKSADQGHDQAKYQLKKAQSELGIQFLLYGDKSDYKKLIKHSLWVVELLHGDLYQESIRIMAQFRLGNCYSQDLGVDRDDAKALKWYRDAAGGRKFSYVQNKLVFTGPDLLGIYGSRPYKIREHVSLNDAPVVEKDSGKSDRIEAQYKLGEIYSQGLGAEKNHHEAACWYQMAALKGHILAQFKLAEFYSKGLGIEVDLENAFILYQLAANQGNSDAQYKLGECFLKGLGVLPNQQAAIDWYQKAGSQGHTDALYALAAMNMHSSKLP